MFGDFSSCLASLLGAWHLYRFSIDFAKEFNIISNVFLMIFPFAHSPCDTLFFDNSIIDLHDFTHPKNMFFHYVPYIVRSQFLHGCLMLCGIEFSSCWTRFGIIVQGLGRSFLWCFLGGGVFRFLINKTSKTSGGAFGWSPIVAWLEPGWQRFVDVGATWRWKSSKHLS